MSRTRGHDARPKERYRKREGSAWTRAAHTKAKLARKKALRAGDFEAIPTRTDFVVIPRDMWP